MYALNTYFSLNREFQFQLHLCSRFQFQFQFQYRSSFSPSPSSSKRHFEFHAAMVTLKSIFTHFVHRPFWISSQRYVGPIRDWP